MGVAQRRLRPGVRRGLFVAGLAVTVVVAGLPAGADTAETGADPSVTLTVSPDDGLSDDQTVFVIGTGFPANTAGLMRLCALGPSVPECDTVVSGVFFTDATGAIPPSPMTVRQVITSFTGPTHNCAVVQCYIVADAGGKSSRHRISFGAAGTTTLPPPTTIGGPTTLPPPTTAPPPTTTPPPTTVPPGPPIAGENILCAVIRALGNLLPGLLGGLADSLLRLLGCAPLN